MPDPSNPIPAPNSTPTVPGTATVPQQLTPQANEPTGRVTDAAPSVPPASPGQNSWSTSSGPVIVLIAVGLPVLLGLSWIGALGISRAGTALSKAAAAQVLNQGSSTDRTASPLQRQAESLLASASSGDESAAQQVLAQADAWTGRTHRTPRSEQFVSACIDSKDPDTRAAAVAAQLAFDGVPRNLAGLAQMEQALANPNQRAWALWMLGALANRGVDPTHAASLIESYLADPDVRTRATAIDGLSLVGSDETVPILLDRFRNDPSPIVQEAAARDLAEAGMYTHAQRMVAAAKLVGWLDDPLLSGPQRAWAAHALSDISGKNFGVDSAAWKSWYARESASN